ncbi:MAG: oligopeptide transporter, OPT family [Verrucomicrobiales bacterium]|nr:oligopeptide transporter, OPT family [Verrucomicrobiales bacterium]
MPAGAVLPEFTVRALVMGTLLGMVFGASSLYLVLKVGLTVSASIPVAVISITLFRLGSRLFGMRSASILENNIVQTAGSAGESIAFGVGVTMPAIMILGFDLEMTRVMLVAILGGLLGILMMIPLRRALIVQQHGLLKYPEGTACAEVLKAGADDASRAAAGIGKSKPSENASAKEDLGAGARVIFGGFALGLIYNTLMKALKGWRDTPEKVFGPPFKGASVGIEITPELLGVGYIIGPRIASIMCAGGVLAYLVLIPAITYFGDGLTTPLPPGGKTIATMSPGQIRNAYVLYIGAGAVAAGGIISVLRSLPLIWHGIRGGLRDYSAQRGAAGGTGANVARTDRDLSTRVVLGGIVALLVLIVLARPLNMNFLGALLIVLFGFLFVTVSSRLTGEIGSSSNPISGMTVATLLLTCLIFLVMGWTGPSYFVTALSIGGIVCIASSNGGTTSQDLKAGFLVGATPRAQQIAILVGALASALILGPILLQLNRAATVYVPASQVAPGLVTEVGALTEQEGLFGPQAASDRGIYRVWHKTDTAGGPAGKYLVDASGRAIWLVDPGINGAFRARPDGSEVPKFEAPKATLMSYIIKGILNRELPWHLVLLGVMIAVVLEMSGIPSLAFAVGVYLPLSASSPIFVGGLIRWLADRHLRRRMTDRPMSEEELSAEGDKSPGVLLASGYIAGGAIAGILIAFVQGVLGDVATKIEVWSTRNNPFYGLEAFEEGRPFFGLGDVLQRMGLFSAHVPDVLSLLPFLGLVWLLWKVSRTGLPDAEATADVAGRR